MRFMAVRAVVEFDFLETRQQQGLPDAPLDESERDEHGREQHNDFGAYLHDLGRVSGERARI